MENLISRNRLKRFQKFFNETHVLLSYDELKKKKRVRQHLLILTNLSIDSFGLQLEVGPLTMLVIYIITGTQHKRGILDEEIINKIISKRVRNQGLNISKYTIPDSINFSENLKTLTIPAVIEHLILCKNINRKHSK